MFIGLKFWSRESSGSNQIKYIYKIILNIENAQQIKNTVYDLNIWDIIYKLYKLYPGQHKGTLSHNRILIQQFKQKMFFLRQKNEFFELKQEVKNSENSIRYVILN